ncbi:MAG: 2-oxoacid:acceptor oxidoreductase family protein, partial [Burkholderiales bacterium]|nr:2-oxoacid:acceptor oxidoreductase family protein [Burkholderiales bacterium]
CVKGFCPSFVTVEGAQPRKPKAAQASLDTLPALPEPALPSIQRPFGILVTGVGGTGIVTIGNLLGMAAHLEGKGVTTLDVTGLAQKGGAVMSHVQIANHPDDIHATRIAMGEAQVVIGCDAIVTASDDTLSRMQHGLTRVVVNSAHTPTAELIKNPNWQFPGSSTEQDIRNAAGDACDFVDAHQLALRLLGDAIYTNPFVLGYAWQKGWIPLSHAALVRAIELNGVAIEKNRQAFEWGRRAAHDLASVQRLAQQDAAPSGANVIALHTPKALDTLIAQRCESLVAYQNAAYAQRYRSLVEKVRAAEQAASANPTQTPLTEAVARGLYKLMAYKDEYEVARLYTDPAFMAKIQAQFEGNYQLKFHLAPPLFAKRDAHGNLLKKQYGPWMMSAFRLLAKLKGLRGGPFDLFGKTEERRTERALIGEYEALVDELLGRLSDHNLPLAVQLASLPEEIRGFGHVKARNLAQVRAKWARLLAQYRNPAQQQVA